MKHFDVSDFIRQHNKILVNIEKDNILIPITIPQDKFETFLLVTDKLQWEMNYSEAGEHKQESGTMSYEEYWSQDANIIEGDLYEYITTHPINYKGQVYTNPVQQLNISFQLAVLKRTIRIAKPVTMKYRMKK